MYFFRNYNLILNTKYKKKTAFILSIIITTTILEILGISLVVPIFAILTENENFNDYLFIRKINDSFFNQNAIFLIIVLVLLIYLFKNLLLTFFSIYQSKFIWSLRKYLAEKIMKKYLLSNNEFLEKENSSKLINILTKEVSYFTHLLLNTLVLASESLILISVITIMLFIETKIFLILIFIIFIYFISVILFSKQKIYNLANERLLTDIGYLRYSKQTIEGIREIKIYNKSDYFLEKFFKSNNDVYRINWKLEQFQNIPRFWMEYIILSFVLLFVWLSLELQGDKNIMLIIGLLAISGARLMPSANKIYQSYQKIKIYHPSLNIILEELKKKDNLDFQSNKKNLTFDKSIEIKDLSFRYDDLKIFQNLNFSIKKGSLIGIYGPNGSGKSTLTDLLFGFLKPQQGTIEVDGENINKNLKGWQNKISYIPQKIFLIDSTILENIFFEDTSIIKDKNFFNNLMEKSGMLEIIKNLPDGIMTNVGERGLKISGGQQQRIALARALVKKPQILVMDEATNSIDSVSVKKIMQTIKEMRGITRIVISHDLEVLKYCDKVFNLSNGSLKEMKYEY